MNSSVKVKSLLRPCSICGSSKGDVLHTQRFLMPQDYILPEEYDLVSCIKCGFTYADADSNQQVYDRYYQQQSIYEDRQVGRGGGSSDYDLKRLSKIAEEVVLSCPDKAAKIIEIGCANGGILKILRDKGYSNLTGVDLSAKCVENISSCGITGIHGTISEVSRLFKFDEQKFDYVILSHVMEHIYDLKSALSQCYDLMSENAKLYLEVPDAARYSDFYVDPYHYFNIEHINHFDEDSLVNLGIIFNFSKCYAGHKTAPVSSTHLWPAVFVVFEKGKTTDKTINMSTKARLSVEKYLELSASSSCAEEILELVKTQEEIYVFGTGNLAFRLLATTDLSKCNIKGFIDNDSKKNTKINNSEENTNKTLINKHIYTPSVLSGFTGTVAICSVQFAREIEDQIKSINKNVKTIILK
jgi:SAM-dependent methyltransferase